MTEIDQLFADWDEIDNLLASHSGMQLVHDKINTSKHFRRGDYDGHGWTINGCIRLPHAKDDF